MNQWNAPIVPNVRKNHCLNKKEGIKCSIVTSSKAKMYLNTHLTILAASALVVSANYYSGYQEMLDQVNAFRQQNGKKPLCNNSKLMQSALKQSQHQANINRMTHDPAPPLSSTFDKMEDAGYKPSAAAENVAQMSNDDVTTVLEAWKNSPDHRKNLLGDYAHFGSAVAKSGSGKYYWTQQFGNSMDKSEGCMDSSGGPVEQPSTPAEPEPVQDAPQPSAPEPAPEQPVEEITTPAEEEHNIQEVPLEDSQMDIMTEEPQTEDPGVATGKAGLIIKGPKQIQDLKRKARKAQLAKKREAAKHPKYICIRSACYRVIQGPNGEGFVPIPKDEMSEKPDAVMV